MNDDRGGSMIDKIWRIVNQTERKLGIDFGIDSIEFSESLLDHHTGYFYTDERGNSIIRIGRGFTRKELPLVVFHELGHCLLWNYKIPRRLLRIFFDDPDSMDIQDSDWRYRFVTFSWYLKAFEPRSNRFVSLYSQVNGEEDFCETMSFYLSGKSSKHQNQIIKEKLRAVKSVLKYVSG